MALNNLITSIDDNNSPSLILMDEILRGTNHQEELAISLSFIERLESMCGFIVGVSSDESVLKYLSNYEYTKIERAAESKDVLEIMR